MTLSSRLRFWIAILFQALMLFAAASALYAQNYQTFAITILAFFLTFLPSIYQRQFKISLPSEYEITILVFIFASLYLGEVYSFYKVFWWWDVFLHALSGVLMFIFAISLLLIMDREERIIFKSPFFVVLFSFSVAMALAVLWELFEYWMDTTWNLNMQKTGLNDTMEDLFANTIGSFIAAFLGYVEIKYQWKLKVMKFFKADVKQPVAQKFTWKD